MLSKFCDVVFGARPMSAIQCSLMWGALGPMSNHFPIMHPWCISGASVQPRCIFAPIVPRPPPIDSCLIHPPVSAFPHLVPYIFPCIPFSLPPCIWCTLYGSFRLVISCVRYFIPHLSSTFPVPCSILPFPFPRILFLTALLLSPPLPLPMYFLYLHAPLAYM